MNSNRYYKYNNVCEGISMTDIDQKIKQKKLEIESLARMLDNAKKDLKALELIKKNQERCKV